MCPHRGEGRHTSQPGPGKPRLPFGSPVCLHALWADFLTWGAESLDKAGVAERPWTMRTGCPAARHGNGCRPGEQGAGLMAGPGFPASGGVRTWRASDTGLVPGEDADV